MSPHVPPLFRTQQAASLARHAVRVTRKRALYGAERPTWNLPFEVLWSFLRERFDETHLPPEVVRARFDLVGGLTTDRLAVQTRPVRAGGVPALWVIPPGASREVLLFLHGGAYVFGSPRSHMPILARLARSTGRRVLALDYRLAPEHPCPAAIDDVVAAWRWLLATGVSPREVVLAGDSAGGGLALTSLLALRDADLPRPSRAVLLSPWTDLTVSGETPRTSTHDYLPDPAHLKTFAARYHGALAPTDPRVSPLFAPDLTGLPPTLILAGEDEVILDDSTRMHHRLREAGVAATLHVEPHQVHVYPLFAPVSRQGRHGIRRISAFARG